LVVDGEREPQVPEVPRDTYMRVGGIYMRVGGDNEPTYMRVGGEYLVVDGEREPQVPKVARARLERLACEKNVLRGFRIK